MRRRKRRTRYRRRLRRIRVTLLVGLTAWLVLLLLPRPSSTEETLVAASALLIGMAASIVGAVWVAVEAYRRVAGSIARDYQQGSKPKPDGIFAMFVLLLVIVGTGLFGPFILQAGAIFAEYEHAASFTLAVAVLSALLWEIVRPRKTRRDHS